MRPDRGELGRAEAGTRDVVARIERALRVAIDDLRSEEGRSARGLWRAALALEHIILSDLLEPAEEDAVLSLLDQERQQACRTIFCALETTIESSFARAALGGGESLLLSDDSIREVYLVRYEELARGEAALSGMKAQDRVLFLGSGPFPITAIEYARRTGCTVDCVDCLPEAVETSTAVVERLGLRDRVRPRLARAEETPAADYSVVLVGVLARPKPAIFARLQATCPPGCRIIARTTAGLRRLIYEPTAVDMAAWPRLRPAGSRRARADQVIAADLFEKA